uniref:AraC family transcriptional regulator N-terminal domain-containing protein n=1 Tax=Roseihalotalea indica TaxID=2867963 RepID=A0AA49GJ76_9BACT|nr:AraC family transcriptional regulator N-terminal domain-containing protein [Tunicatimonas sp. TK19036]
MKEHYIQPINLSDSSTIENLVEHRRVFTLNKLELGIFETFHQSYNVTLSHQGLVITSMLRGRKVMHYDNHPSFDFLPGSTIIVPDGVSMRVSFPDAAEHSPVQCATLTLDWAVVDQTLNFLNEHYPREQKKWELEFSRYHFVNNRPLAESINRLITISMEDDVSKDALADLALKTLLIRVVLTQQETEHDLHTLDKPNELLLIEKYIRQHLTDKISIDDLCDRAGLSKSSLFRLFKANHQMSPVSYINHQRIYFAKELLNNPDITISEACYRSGFNHVSYFDKLFKKVCGKTPKEHVQAMI